MRRLALYRSEKLGFARCRDLELDVDAIGQRSRDAAAVARNALGRAAAAPAAIAAVTARTGVHRGDELEARREKGLARGARDRHASGLERLAQRFEHVAVKLRQLVEKEHPVVRERDLARPRQVAATDERGARGAVVRSAEGPLAPAARFETRGGHRMD